jgi:predicted alpha/beta superfamily hydrolase
MPSIMGSKSSNGPFPKPEIQTFEYDNHRVDVLVPGRLDKSTPVLVMHDGMNVFFEEYASSGDTWEVIEGINRGRIIGSPLVIAVWGEGGEKKYNTRRINEFLCDDIFATKPHLWETLRPFLRPETKEPRGNYMVSLVADQIIPDLLTRYGVIHHPQRTAILGCSVAGVASIYSLAKRPDIFGAALALSSHWEFGGMELVNSLADLVGAPKGRMIWTDSGSESLDSSSYDLNENFAQAAESYGFTRRKNLEAITFWGTAHHESVWSRRLEYPVNWWLLSLQSIGQ